MRTRGDDAARVSGGDGSEPVVVELQQVVRRRDEAPLASARRPASALEASDRAVELDLAEHGLDGDLALAVEGAPVGRGQHAAHEVIKASGPAGTSPPPVDAVVLSEAHQTLAWDDEQARAPTGERLPHFVSERQRAVRSGQGRGVLLRQRPI
jgi:hypothetical protein